MLLPRWNPYRTVHNYMRSSGRARGLAPVHPWKRGADIDYPRSGSELDRAVPPGRARGQSVLS